MSLFLFQSALDGCRDIHEDVLVERALDAAAPCAKSGLRCEGVEPHCHAHQQGAYLREEYRAPRDYTVHSF